MQEIIYKSTRYPHTDRSNAKTERRLQQNPESNSPQSLFRSRDSPSHGQLLNSNSSEVLFTKSSLKQQLVSLKTLPKSQYKSKLSSLLSNISTSNSPVSSISLSPRGKDSINSNTEQVQHLNRNVLLKPLYTLSNNVARAGYKIHNALMNGHHTSVLIKAAFQNIRGKYVFCLADSHGPHSRNILDFFKKNLLSLLEQHIHVEPELGAKSLATLDEFLMTTIKNSEINLNFSGCSLINLMIYGDTCFIWNIGDCQAVLAKEVDSWKCKMLNKPHNLKILQERTRILEFGGKIHEISSNQGKTERFDLGGSKSPRFHLTRSLGDLSGKPIGISNRAEITKFTIRPEDRFIIIANSSFWDLVSLAEAVTLVQGGWKEKKTEVCCESLIKFAGSRLQDYSAADEDLAVMVLFFNH